MPRKDIITPNDQGTTGRNLRGEPYGKDYEVKDGSGICGIMFFVPLVLFIIWYFAKCL